MALNLHSNTKSNQNFDPNLLSLKSIKNPNSREGTGRSTNKHITFSNNVTTNNINNNNNNNSKKALLSSKNILIMKQTESDMFQTNRNNNIHTGEILRNITGLAPSQKHINHFQTDQTLWYQKFCKYKYLTNIPNDLPQHKQSTPYRLIISNISGLPSGKKSGSSDMHLCINGTLFVISLSSLEIQIIPISHTYQYICQEPVNDKSWKHQYPIIWYYHSKIDKNSRNFQTKLILNFQLKEIKGNYVQNIQHIGHAVINPFQECDYGDFPITLTKGTTEIQLLTKQGTPTNTSINLNYSISSYLQIKKIVKFLPSQSIFSNQDKISGIWGDYLPNSKGIIQVFEAGGYDIKIKSFQFQIPQKYEDEVIRMLKDIPSLDFKPSSAFTLSPDKWKIACGFHNQYKPVSLSTRKLNFIQKDSTGANTAAWKVSVFDALNQGQNLTIPYYKNEDYQSYNYLQDSLFVISLIYQLEVYNNQSPNKNKRITQDIQIGFFAFRPILTGNLEEINQAMICQAGMGVYSRLLGVNCDRLPTIILQYQSSQMQDFEAQQEMGKNFMKQGGAQLFQNLLNPNQGTVRSRVRSRHRISSQNLKTQMRQKQGLLQQIQRQRLKLQRDKQQLQRIKTQNYIVYQQDFQRKFQEQKQNLQKRQEMLQHHYRQQVQKQIRAKVQMQNQIRNLKQMIAGFQTGGNMQQQRSKKLSYQDSIHQQQNYLQIQSKQRSARLSPRHPFQYNQDSQPNNILIKHRIDPSYFVDPEPNIPPNRLRQILKSHQPLNLQTDYGNYMSASRFTISFSAINWNSNIVPPNNIFAIIYFFNFREFRTEVMTYQDQLDLLNENFGSHQNRHFNNQYKNQRNNIKNKDIYHRLISRNSSLTLDNNQPSYNFTVDPSLHNCPPIFQQDLINYLAENCLIIDFFDADSYLYLGQINLKLRELLRGKKKQTLIAKEYSIRKQGLNNSSGNINRGGDFNQNTLNIVGNIHILVKNQETACKNLITNTNRLTINKTQKQIKRKVVSNNPINLPSKLKTEEQEGITSSLSKNQTNQKLNRQEMRIKNFKKAQEERSQLNGKVAGLNQFLNVPQNQKPHVLNNIQAYKQKKLPNYLKEIYSSLLSSHVKISTHYGKSQTFVHEFVNNSINAGSFKIVIDSGNLDRGISTNNTLGNNSKKQDPNKQKQAFLQVINNSSQWKYFSKKYKYQQPKSFQMINDTYTFYLNAGQSLPILFRYLSFSGVQQQVTTYNVTIIKDDSLLMVDGFTVEILHHQQILHHCYTFYQPGEQTIDIVVPVVYSPSVGQKGGSNYPNHNQNRMLYLTKQNISAQWISQYQILIRLQSPKIMQNLDFNLLLYSDQHFDHLLQNWKIKIHSYQGIYTMSRMQGNTKFKIMLPQYLLYSNRSDLLNFFSSNDKLVINRDYSNGNRQIWCQLSSQNNQYEGQYQNNQIKKTKNIEITCIDISRNKLIYGWVIQILPYILRRV